MSRRRLLTLALWIAAFLVLAWTLRKVSLAEALDALGRISPLALIAIVAVNLVALVVFALRWWIILRALEHPIPVRAATLYRLAAFGFSYFTPGPQFGGEPIQLLLAEKRAGLSRTVALTSLLLDRLLELTVNFAFLAAAALFLVRRREALFVGVLFAAPALYLISLSRGRRPLSSIFERLRGTRFRSAQDLLSSSEGEAGRFCNRRPLGLTLALAASLASWALILFEYWLVARSLGMPLDFGRVVLGVTALRVAYLLFFPAAVGVLEAGQLAAVTAMGFSPELGISLSIIARVRDVVLGGTGVVTGMKALLAPIRK
jgi:uncharacterized protein (TIRG00374 family)